MSSPGPLVFYFPHHDVGGVPVLFLRLAARLAREHPVFVADYADGYMAKNLPEGVGLIRVDAADVFPRDAVFVFQSFLPWRFPFLSRVGAGSRALFWNLHPKNFDGVIFNPDHPNPVIAGIAAAANLFAAPRREKIADFVGYLLERDALAVMDRENAGAVAKALGRDPGAVDFLPVPVPGTSLRKQPPAPGGAIRCAWVGRLADFKYRILEHLIQRLAGAAAQTGPLRLVVIGDGEYATYLRAVGASAAHGGFQVEFVGEMPSAALPRYLVDNADILFSMGTSALEGAALGLPVFLTDYSYRKLEGNYRFSMLYENSGFCLGEQISAAHYERESTLEDSIRSVMSDYAGYSARCYGYWKKNFDLDAVAPRLLERCRATRASFGEMAQKGFFEPDRAGLVLRRSAWFLRGNLSGAPVGFRNDC